MRKRVIKKKIYQTTLIITITVFLICTFTIIISGKINDEQLINCESLIMSNNSSLTKEFSNINAANELFNPFYRDEYSGTAKGRGSLSIPTKVTGTLQGFDFDYISGDHHMAMILAAADNNKVQYMYQDKKPDDKYNWCIRRAQVPNDSDGYVVSGKSKGADEVALGYFGEYMPVMVAFVFYYTYVCDHHMYKIGAEFVNNQNNFWDARVDFSDKSPNDKNDTFSWYIIYALVHRSKLVRDSPYIYSGTATKSSVLPMPNDVINPVLQGFHFSYTSPTHIDRHIDRICVLLSPDDLSVAYGDKEPSDEFRWRVRFNSLVQQ